MLTTGADLICCSSRVWGAASAAPVRCTIASTEPVESSTPNSSRASSVVSRRDTRCLTASVTTVACNRGPNTDRGSSRGSSARVAVAHSGQQTPCSRCSLTRTAIAGSSATWWRHGSTASTSSCSANTCAQAWQRSGQCSTISSTRSGGSSRRCLPSCPGWPPGVRPEPGRRGRGAADGGSCDGGSDELRELRLSRRSSSTTRASSRRFASTNSPTRKSSATALSRSPSRIASTSTRSMPPNFGVTLRVPAQGLNAYRLSERVRTGANRRLPLPCRRSWVRVPSSAFRKAL